MANKIKFGLRSVHYATITISSGTITYGTPVALPGAVTLSLSQAGEKNDFYADDMIYFSQAANNGYTGTLELADLPASFKEDILKQTVDTKSVYIEDADQIPANFALGFEIQGDEKGRRTWLYNCSVSRPNIDAQTKEASITPNTVTLDLTVMPRETDRAIKAELEDSTSTHTDYASWFSAVYD